MTLQNAFRCLLCGNTQPPGMVCDTVKHDPKGQLRAVECGACGHVQLSPPDYHLDFYEDDGQVSAVVKDYGTPMEKIFEHSWIEARRRTDRLAEYGIDLDSKGATRPRVLDVGGGYGFFGSHIKQSIPDADVTVMEPSRTRADMGKHAIAKRYGADAVPAFDVAELDEDFANEHAGAFDLVTLWHVLEHLPAPADLLRLCMRLLKPSCGCVCVEVPNHKDDLLGLSPAYRERHYMSEHISYFDPSGLKRLARQAAPGADISVHGYQRYGIFNYFHWIHFNAPQGADPDLFPGKDRMWLESSWRTTKEAACMSDALFMTIRPGVSA